MLCRPTRPTGWLDSCRASAILVGMSLSKPGRHQDPSACCSSNRISPPSTNYRSTEGEHSDEQKINVPKEPSILNSLDLKNVTTHITN